MSESKRSKSASILDEYREKYPEPAHDWRFRAGRMAEELEAARPLVGHVRRMTEWCKHEGDNDACTSCELVAAYEEVMEEQHEG